ncbi:MAG: DNA recombination protein RmuC [Candidatus Magasanikbacteria bacterium]
MEQLLLILLTILLIAALVGIYIMYKKLKQLQTEENKDSMMMLQKQIQQLNKTVDEKMQNTHKEMSKTKEKLNKSIKEQYKENKETIKDITKDSKKELKELQKKLTSLEKTNEKVMDYSEQLQDLKQVLTHQKRRGALGEAGLKLILENILPPMGYEMQYKFEDGDQVDAVVKTKNGLIPVDAKFSLDNYSRLMKTEDKDKKEKIKKQLKKDLKNRIKETSKYIKPNQGTLEFAFMFIPAEAIYYDLLVNKVGSTEATTRNLIEYAHKDKNVIIVSPTTFAAYLQTVLQGLKSLQIEESAKEIRKNVEKLKNHIQNHDTYMQKLGKTLSTTVNHFNTAYDELRKVDKDVAKITEVEQEIEAEQVEGPELES